jgi:hypothetical protein
MCARNVEAAFLRKRVRERRRADDLPRSRNPA